MAYVTAEDGKDTVRDERDQNEILFILVLFFLSISHNE